MKSFAILFTCTYKYNSAFIKIANLFLFKLVFSMMFFVRWEHPFFE
ncbi:hypothetical protein [Spiroplasma endosymbiont of Tipula paludosa]